VTEPEKITFKNKLKVAGEHIIEQRIATAKSLVNNAQEAANNEEKVRQAISTKPQEP